MGRQRVYDTRVTFPTRLRTELGERVDRYRAKEGLTRNRLIELALEEYLDRRETPRHTQPFDWRTSAST